MDLYRHIVDEFLSVVVEEDHTIVLEITYTRPIRRVQVDDVHALVEALIHAKIERDHHDDEHAFFGDTGEAQEAYYTAMEIIDAGFNQ